jgi:hypothetical protein
MSSIIDDYVTVPRSMVRSTEVANFKEIKVAPDEKKKEKTPQVSPSTDAGSSSSITVKTTPVVASRSDEKLFQLVNRITMPTMKRGKNGKFVSGDQPIKAILVLATTGSWVNTASTPTVYSGMMTPFGCNEFAEYTKCYEQYLVKRIDAHLWSGGVNAARSVSGTSVATGEPLLAAWSNGPLAAVPTYNQIADMQDSKLVDYLHKSVHHFKHYPKNCYVDVGSDTFQNSVGWQSTSSATDHAWGTFCWSTGSGAQAVTASGLTYTIVYKFDVEFRRRRYTG